MYLRELKIHQVAPTNYNNEQEFALATALGLRSEISIGNGRSRYQPWICKLNYQHMSPCGLQTHLNYRHEMEKTTSTNREPVLPGP